MIICLAGMHRSGTSLMSSYLHANGISMGENMLGAGQGNELGHYEDVEFLGFHKNILKSNKCNTLTPKQNLTISEEQALLGNKLIQHKKENNGDWGWKEPRSTLFLDYWYNIVPDAKFILMYRDPHEVIDSIYRRMRSLYFYGKPWLAQQSWLRYNQDVIKFYDKHPEQTFLVSINGLNSNIDASTKRLSAALNRPLTADYTKIYKPQNLGNNPTKQKARFPTDIYKRILNSYYSQELKKMYNDLQFRAIIKYEGK